MLQDDFLGHTKMKNWDEQELELEEEEQQHQQEAEQEFDWESGMWHTTTTTKQQRIMTDSWRTHTHRVTRARALVRSSDRSTPASFVEAPRAPYEPRV